jgi:hypothetical protein
MREKLGTTLMVAGFILMPYAVIQGMNDAIPFGTELLLAAMGFLMIFVGRGLRAPRAPK